MKAHEISFYCRDNCVQHDSPNLANPATPALHDLLPAAVKASLSRLSRFGGCAFYLFQSISPFSPFCGSRLGHTFHNALNTAPPLHLRRFCQVGHIFFPTLSKNTIIYPFIIVIYSIFAGNRNKSVTHVTHQ